MTFTIALGLADDIDCDLNNSCVFDIGHDGPCAAECDECEGSGINCSCFDGLVWSPR